MSFPLIPLLLCFVYVLYMFKVLKVKKVKVHPNRSSSLLLKHLLSSLAFNCMPFVTPHCVVASLAHNNRFSPAGHLLLAVLAQVCVC